MRLWSQACARFHAYRSPLDARIDEVVGEGLEGRPDLVEFVVAYLELDPPYFRSGYAKESMIPRLKRARLSASQRDRVDAVLLDAVRRRGRREFRRYCQLAAALGTAGLRAEIEQLSDVSDRALASRARMMGAYMDKHGKRNP